MIFNLNSFTFNQFFFGNLIEEKHNILINLFYEDSCILLLKLRKFDFEKEKWESFCYEK